MFRLHLTRLTLICALITGAASGASAVPLLQFDIKNGIYVGATDGGTTEATSQKFTLYAFLTPPSGISTTDLNALLNDTYYVAAALSPKVSAAQNLGGFTYNNAYIQATQDMVYGDPPIERLLGGGASADTGDLAQHDIYNTYFKEFSFKFTPTQKATAYDVVTQSSGSLNNGPTTQWNGGMYYMAFTVDTKYLNPSYKIHFDMYSESVKSGGDVDVNKYTPFTYDAQSRYGGGSPIPEPTSLLLLGSGMVAVAAQLRRKKTPASVAA